MTLSSVVLPDPFGPIRPTISPCSTRKSTRSTAVSPLNCMTTSLRFEMHRRVSPGRDAPDTGRGAPGSYFTAGNFSGKPTDSTTNFFVGQVEGDDRVVLLRDAGSDRAVLEGDHARSRPARFQGCRSRRAPPARRTCPRPRQPPRRSRSGRSQARSGATRVGRRTSPCIPARSSRRRSRACDCRHRSP